jgi:hypothetical protein
VVRRFHDVGRHGRNQCKLPLGLPLESLGEASLSLLTDVGLLQTASVLHENVRGKEDV